MSEHVVFVHSTGTSPMLWRGIPGDVLGGRAALFPANLGYPPNPPIARGERVSLEDEVEHLLGAIPADGAPVHLVAHSYGATVALVLADRPALRGRLASMFLAEPALFGALLADDDGDVTEHDPEAVATARASFAGDSAFLDEERGGDAEWLEELIDYWNRPGSWSQMPAALREQALALGWKMFQEVRSGFELDRPFRAWRIDVPTTLVLGERTTLHSRAMTRALARSHPRGDLAVVEMKGTGHMAPLTHPQLVAAELARHFARIEALRATGGTQSIDKL